MKKSIICFYVMVFCFLGSCSAAMAEGAEIVPLDQKIDGYSYSDYAEGWWRWVSMEESQLSPANDNTGEQCANNQYGDVWFLAGGIGHSKIKRTCKIPAGKYVFFPVINTALFEYNQGKEKCRDLQKKVALNNDRLEKISVSVDGKEIKNPENFRVQSNGCFDFEGYSLNTNHYIHYARAVTDGYWIMLKPLNVGSHSIKFYGAYNRPASKGQAADMVQDIEYDIEVVEDE